ncbi:hypothetical protein LTR95_018764 [Oleoguttula sp. CCFEE 5521]
MPVIHNPTFSSRDCDHPLLLNMIVLGSMFIAGNDTVAKADALWRLANAAVATSWEGLLKRKGLHDQHPGTQLVVTSYLRSMYAMLSASQELRSIGQTSLGLGFQWARQCGIVTAASQPKPTFLPSALISTTELDTRWRVWVSEETQRRAILGHYVLDGLLTDFTGQPTAVRHTANPLMLPYSDRLYDAKTADGWLHEVSLEAQDTMTFRQLYIVLFDAESTFEALRLSYLSIRVVLEALQSLIYEHHELGGCTIGTPSKTNISFALSRLHRTQINTLSSTQERVEHAIRWHVICIRMCVETSSIARQICELYNIPQTLHTIDTQSGADIHRLGRLQTRDDRRALLHAVALAELGLQLNLGRAHAVHLPMAIYTAAVIFAAVLANMCRAGRKTVIAVPIARSWDDLSESVDNSDPHGPVSKFLSGVASDSRDGWTKRNVADDLNGLYLIMQQLQPYWGVSAQLSDTVRQWLLIPSFVQHPGI